MDFDDVEPQDFTSALRTLRGLRRLIRPTGSSYSFHLMPHIL